VTGAVAASVEPAHRGAALGLLNLAFMIGGAVDSAVAGGLSGLLGVAGALAAAAAFPLVAALIAIAGPARPRLASALVGQA
jgi:MFS transporter, DHA2 family, metal-tetracycline-proton antiporter